MVTMKFLFMSQPDFACNPYALWKYITENTNHKTAWLVYKEERYEALKERKITCALYDTHAGNKLVQEADYIVANSYTFKNIVKHDNQILVNLWHGSGIKAHDYYHRDANVAYLDGIKKYFNMVDLMCVHSLDDRFRLSAMLNYDIRNSFVTGQPRLDCVTISDGKEKLRKIYGDAIDQYDCLIFFAPSFRANMSGHSGKMLSDNIFRLTDYDDKRLAEFLKISNAAIIYKLHPIEQNAFKGRKININDRCIELTDEMLFECGIQYDEILSAFDAMITDYSSIAFDYLLLDRPIVYLLPDYEEYKSSKGFVFNNIDYYMPGKKAFDFNEMISALKSACENPMEYTGARQNVLMQRFDYTDGNSSKRCYETILNYVPLKIESDDRKTQIYTNYPTAADHLKPYFDEKIEIIDGTKPVSDIEVQRKLEEHRLIYITEYKYDANARISEIYRGKVINPELIEKYEKDKDVHICYVSGGVDYDLFSSSQNLKPKYNRIGFAGTIDSRIYFAMVQVICEAFPDYEIVFAGEILGNRPAWLDGFDNLKYVKTAYEDLPEIISTFEVCLLPFYGRHKEAVPSELFQYMAAGKNVVTSDMRNIPQCSSIYSCKSIDEAIIKIKEALIHNDNNEDAKKIAKEYDWKMISEKILKSIDV